ncbi:MAG: helicase, partial [Prevotella sp.]
MRQQSDNDIIVAANKIRQLYQNPPRVKWGKFPLRNRKHVHLYPSQLQLLNAYIRNIKANGFNSATLICGTNRLCLSLTNLVRPALGFNQSVLMPGELLLVTQNNCLSGLMNGDLVKVLQLGTRFRRAGLTFLEVEVEELFTHRVVKQLLIEDILYSSHSNLKQYDQQALFIDYYHRMKDKKIGHKSQAFKDFMLTDPYLNAIRAVYGYALTCHKAQGGEWKDVYLDIPRKFSFETSKPQYQWVYTAVTRAADQLHIVDDFFIA